MAQRQQATEKATPKKKREFRKEGRVAKSAELGSWFSLVVLAGALPALGARATHQIAALMANVSANMSQLDSGKALGLFGHGLWTMLSAVLPVLGVVCAAGVASNLGQVGVHFSPGALGFRWSRVDPRSGIKRIVSPSGIWELAKGVARLALLVVVGYSVFRHLLGELMGPGTLPIGATLTLTASGLFSLGRNVGLVAFGIAALDYGFQRRRFNESLKMTKEEVRQEQRETEGSPEIRREQRRRRRRLTRMQILAALNQADVVVVNPTHYAVALAYDRAHDHAPRVIGKAEDELALVFRVEAIAKHVPVVENPPIARALHGACDIGQEVPASLYETVARLLAFVYRLSPTARHLVDVHHMSA
jgi:flagellar biosynthetic protein FlhB